MKVIGGQTKTERLAGPKRVSLYGENGHFSIKNI